VASEHGVSPMTTPPTDPVQEAERLSVWLDKEAGHADVEWEDGAGDSYRKAAQTLRAQAEEIATLQSDNESIGRIAFAEKRRADAAEAQLREAKDNHHNALTCPYCNPKGQTLVQEARAQVEQLPTYGFDDTGMNALIGRADVLHILRAASERKEGQ